MLKVLVAFAFAATAITSVSAQPAGSAPAVQPSTLLTTADTPIGDLLDNPQAKAVLTKYLPEVVNSDQIDMARGMSLKAIQSYASDQITDAKLAQIDAELAKLSVGH